MMTSRLSKPKYRTYSTPNSVNPWSLPLRANINMASRAEKLESQYEHRPDPQATTGHDNPEANSSTGVDYEPHPEQSIKLSPERQDIVNAITRLYSGGASEDDMYVYAAEAVYDDPWSYCDTRYKIAGQWYGVLFLPIVCWLACSTASFRHS